MDPETVKQLTQNLGMDLVLLREQMENVQKSYDELWKEVNRATVISTADQLVQALKTPNSNWQLARGTYTGNFEAVANGVTIIGLAPTDSRIQEGQTTPYTLAASDKYQPTLKVTGSKFSMSGISIPPAMTDRPPIIVGNNAAMTPEEQPDNVVLDRMEVIAPNNGKRGIECHSRAFMLARSLVIGYRYPNADSQAFYSANGPGPYNIVNNELGATGENIMFGGGTTKTVDMIPSNVLISQNLIKKPLAWKGTANGVKNSVEFKCVKGARVENNIIDGCWKDAQSGNMIVLTPRNQNGTSPFTVVEDVVIVHNRTLNHFDGYAISILYTDNEKPSGTCKRVRVENNLFQDSPKGVIISKGIDDGLRVTFNTFPAIKGNLITFDGSLTTYHKFPLVYLNNVALSGAYGANGNDTAPGTPSLTGYTDYLEFTGNVIEKTPLRPIPWPDGNTLLNPGNLAALLDENYEYKPGGAGWTF